MSLQSSRGRITKGEGATSTEMGEGVAEGRAKELAFWLVVFLGCLLRMISLSCCTFYLLNSPLHPLMSRAV